MYRLTSKHFLCDNKNADNYICGRVTVPVIADDSITADLDTNTLKQYVFNFVNFLKRAMPLSNIQ